MSYDNTCKFIAETFTADLTAWLLGEPVEMTVMEPSELVAEPVRADSLVMLESRSLIFHTEFQVEPRADVPYRMANYRLRVYHRHPEKEMQQVVVYLRETQSPRVFQTTFELARMRHEFDVIRIWEEPVERFLETPGLLPFAVLARTSDREATLRQVSGQIEAIGDREQQGDVAASTAVLAGLVLEKQFIRSVLREDVMKESVIYQDIVSTAEERGRDKGKREEGLSFASRLLKRRFGTLSPEVMQEIEELSLVALEELGEALFDISDEAGLTAWLRERQ